MTQKKRMFRLPLWQQIIIASIIGVTVGLISHDWGLRAKVLGDVFIRLIQMTIIPLVFPLIVIGIANMHSGKNVGRMALKSIIYFEVVTTVLMLMSVGLVNLFGSGKGVNITGGDASTVEHFASSTVDIPTFLVEIVPTNLIAAMAEGHLLAVLFFGVIFGVALGGVGDKGVAVLGFLRSLSDIMFKVVSYVVALSPIGVFGFVAYSFAAYGWEKVSSLVDLIAVVYLGLALTTLVIFPLIARLFRVPYFRMLAYIKDLLLIVASTRTSEAVLAPSMKRLEEAGVADSAVSFVMPLGYSFNLDGGSLYWTPALLFVANAFGMEMSFEQQIQLVITLLIMSKGIAGVAGANIVVLTSIAAMFGLPMEGIALLFAIDWVCDIGRTVTNVIGNNLATLVVARSEHLIDEEKMKRVLGSRRDEPEPDGASHA